MSFDELQSIWDSQSQPDGLIDEAELLTAMKRRERSFNRIVNITELSMAATLLFVALMFFRDPVIQGHDKVLIIPGIGCLIAVAFVWRARVARKKREVNFGSSLLGIIEKSIDGIDDRVRRLASFLWWFALPNSIGLVIALFIIDESKRYLLTMIFIPAFCICMALAYWQIRREIRNVWLPERRRFEALQAKLMQSAEP